MARLPVIPRTAFSAELSARAKGLAVANVFGTVAHSEPTARAFYAMTKAILFESSLNGQLRELVILRVGALSRAPYEIHHHRRLAQQLGLSDEKIAAALQQRDDTCLTSFEQLVMHFTDAVVWQVKAPEFLYRPVADQLGPAGICELLQTIGFYMAVSRVLENLEVDIEDEPASAQPGRG